MRRGFTLIELLVVIGVICMLMAMAMPMLSVVRNMMRRSSTEYVLKRTDTALRLFKADWGIYPCQASYPDPFSGAGFPNRLAYQIGSEIDAPQADLVRADMATAARQYDEANVASTIKYVAATDMSPRYSGGHAIACNRSAREQVRLAVLSGNLTMRGPIITHMTDAGVISVKSDRSATLVLGSPTSATAVGPGWAGDYLNGELDRAFRDGQAVLDAWGKPLVYINRSVPGVTTANTKVSGVELGQDVAPRNYDVALGATGFEINTSVAGLAQTVKNANRQRLLYFGRIRLDDNNAGDGLPVLTSTSDPLLPYPGKLMQSDMRYFCLRGYELEFELWSVGRNGSFSYVRDAAENNDNLAITPYNKAKL